MRKFFYFIAFALLMVPMGLKAQVYEYQTEFDTLYAAGDTLRYEIPHPAAGAWGAVTVRLVFDGAFYDLNDFMTLYDESFAYIGITRRNECGPLDSVSFDFSSALLSPWLADDTLCFYLVMENGIDMWCDAHAKLVVTYNYCSFGTPVSIAGFTMSDTTFCPTEGLVSLTANPAGGTFSGPGVSGSSFNPGQPSGTYLLQYTATDAIGCISTDRQVVFVSPIPWVKDTFACPGAPINIIPEYGNDFVWYSDQGLSNVIDTTFALTTEPLIATTTYYVSGLDHNDYFKITQMADTGSNIADIDATAGDDRGGIAITPDHVYFIGDEAIVRFDPNLTPASLTSFQRSTDGFFSDLRTGDLWTIANGNTFPNSGDFSGFLFTELRGLDENLQPNSAVIPLSSPIPMLNSENSYNGIFAGYGFVIIYSGVTSHFYAVDLNNGMVSDLGLLIDPQFNASENWSVWGIAEKTPAGYSILFRDNASSDIMRRQLPDSVAVTAFGFSDLSDCATIGFSPWNDRWYFHYENSGQFGGVEETAGYATAADSIWEESAPVASSCYSEVEVFVNNVDLGPDTTVCAGNQFIFSAGLGFSSYSWNGVHNNWNVCWADTTGAYAFEGVDLKGCIIRDTAYLTVNPCLGVNEHPQAALGVYPNPSDGKVTVEIPQNLFEGTCQLSISDLQGRNVLNVAFEPDATGYLRSLDLSALSTGLYELMVADSKTQMRVKLVIQ